VPKSTDCGLLGIGHKIILSCGSDRFARLRTQIQNAALSRKRPRVDSSRVAPAKLSDECCLQQLGRLTAERSFSVVTSGWPVTRPLASRGRRLGMEMARGSGLMVRLAVSGSICGLPAIR
jgi:hypothetical protein